ncbi:MAG: DegV family protein [Chloroflexota bacterium]
MSKVGIVTDSTSCLPPDLVREYDIRIVPATFSIDGKSYMDQVDISSDEFWRLFKGAKQMPTTGAISPGAFVNTFTELAESTDSILCILVSKALSAINESAVQGRDMMQSRYPNLNIEIIDSKISTGAMGFIVLEAARAAWEGKSLHEVARVAQDMIPRVKFVVAMETLKYLIKTGRAPKTAHIGNVLQVKPMIGMVSGTGEVESVGRVRGKRKAMEKLVDMVGDYIDTSKPIHLMVHYTDRFEEGEELKRLAISRYDCAEVYLTSYTPVMASATGPVLCLAFYS